MQKNAGTHGLQNAKMLNFFVQQYKELSEQKYSLFAHLMFHWIILMCISKECLVKTISHEWVRQIYLDSAEKIEEKKCLAAQAFFNYDEQHQFVNGKSCVRIVVIDAVTKKYNI